MRKEFERVTPESVGIRSKAIMDYIDALERSNTEMHGLMIMRHGKICAEGWWQPFAPGLRHGLQSHTKTYAATAVGIAYTCLLYTSSAGDTQSASDKGEPTKVVFAMQTFNVVPPTETIQTVADEVNRYIRETYPEVNIELEWVLYGPGDYTKKINLMMQSGDQLDIFIPSNIATSLSTNQLAPITEALETYGQDLTAIIKEYCGDDVFETCLLYTSVFQRRTVLPSSRTNVRYGPPAFRR